MMRPIVSIVPFEQLHLAMIRDRPEQRGEAERFGAARGASAEHGPAFSAVETDDAGRLTAVLACAGLLEVSPHYAIAWAYFADGLRAAQWSPVTHAIRAVLDGCDYARVDMLVSKGFAAAQRYAEALGFVEDAAIYTRKGAPPCPAQPLQPEPR